MSYLCVSAPSVELNTITKSLNQYSLNWEYILENWVGFMFKSTGIGLHAKYPIEINLSILTYIKSTLKAYNIEVEIYAAFYRIKWQKIHMWRIAINHYALGFHQCTLFTGFKSIFKSTVILVSFSALVSSIIFSVLLLMSLCTRMLHYVIPFLE